MLPNSEQLPAISVRLQSEDLILRGEKSVDDNSDSKPTATRFAPVIASASEPPFTAYHSKYLAYELTKRVGADQADKLAQSLSNAIVDLNPHQVDAALFAFRSPFSRGAILADEVGLGKTIEAGIIISQLWAEKKRRILIIVPASLRKQWSQELAEKFFIPSWILEAKSFRELSRNTSSLFQPTNQVVICSYHFARAKTADITAVPWDLVVIDEAHRLRNVYKKDNKIARALRDAVKENLERELKNIEVEIREAKKLKRLSGDLQSKLAAQKRVNELEQQRNHKKRTLYDAQDQIELRKDSLIADVEARLQQKTNRQDLFTIRWSLT